MFTSLFLLAATPGVSNKTGKTNGGLVRRLKYMFVNVIKSMWNPMPQQRSTLYLLQLEAVLSYDIWHEISLICIGFNYPV